MLLTRVRCHTVGMFLWGSSFFESRHSSCHVALKSVKKIQNQIIDQLHQIPSPSLFRKKEGSNTHIYRHAYTHPHRYARTHTQVRAHSQTHTCSNQMKRIETHKTNKTKVKNHLIWNPFYLVYTLAHRMNDREKQWRPSMNNKHKLKFYIILNKISTMYHRKKKRKKKRRRREKRRLSN